MHGRIQAGYGCLVAALLGAACLPAIATERPFEESPETGSALFLENDWLLKPVHLHQDDRNYTMGIAWHTSGSRIKDWSLAKPFQWIDGWVARHLPALRYGDAESSAFSHSFDVGVSAFTPDNLGAHEPIHDDRPYASLLFVDVKRRAVNKDDRIARTTELSLGVYGLSVAKRFQRFVHKRTQGADGTPVVPEGWNNQISHGGEPTIRYGHRSQLKLASDSGYDIQATGQFNVGYYTNAGVGAAVRVGRISSYWWQFDATNIDQSALTASTTGLEHRRSEAYLWAGANATAWAYNGLLQGQFRHSEVRVPWDKMERVVYDYTLGATFGGHTKRRWHSLSIAFSNRSPEADFATRRSHQWGGIYYSTVRLRP